MDQLEPFAGTYAGGLGALVEWDVFHVAGGERLFGRGRTEGVHGGDEGYDGRKDGQFLGLGPDLVGSHIVPLCFWLRDAAHSSVGCRAVISMITSRELARDPDVSSVSSGGCAG